MSIYKVVTIAALISASSAQYWDQPVPSEDDVKATVSSDDAPKKKGKGKKNKNPDQPSQKKGKKGKKNKGPVPEGEGEGEQLEYSFGNMEEGQIIFHPHIPKENTDFDLS